MNKHKEIRFEEAIEQYLIEHGGYVRGDAKAFDPQKALFPNDVISFIEKSQLAKWQAIQSFHGTKADTVLVDSLFKELTSKGMLNVLRHGFKCFGKNFRMAYFTPNSKMNPDAWADYALNRLTITRQVRFDPKDQTQSIDVLLAVNGLPIVTMELKNPLTKQTVADGKRQYREDRDPLLPLFRFKERALVHFVVDTDLVFMTTKLDGKKTFFLPFNRGNGFGSGNPAMSGNYRTGYLWEEVLTKDSLMDILARFMHLQIEEKQIVTLSGIKKHHKETMIFPRYHQLDAVRSLIQDAKTKGSGHNYLIQHSAGSGKSNSIAWLAHRLASLHDDQDKKYLILWL